MGINTGKLCLRSTIFSVLLIVSALPVFAGVTVSSPANGATVSSPVRVVASATAANPITAMRIYLDYTSVYTVNASRIDTSISASVGQHNVTVQAWDSTGAVYKSSITVTVSGATAIAPTAPAPTSGTHRYVSTSGSDSNDGTSSRPWRTIAKAASMAKPGYVIHVAPGTYTSGRITSSTSGTSSARIRYISDSKWGAKLVGTQSGQWGMVWYNTGNYVDIVGFDATGAGAWGLVSAGSYVRYMNNHAHDLRPGSCWGTGGAGIAHSNYKATGNETISNMIHNVGNPSVQCSTVHGMYQMNGYGKIMNNIVFNNWGWGIHTYHATTNLTISNNTVFNNTYGGIVISASSGDFAGGYGRHDNSLISNNIVYNNGKISGAAGYGIEEYGSSSSIGPNNRYLNNLVYNNGPANWRLMVTGGSGSGTVTAPPNFMNFTGTMSGNYRVNSTSKAIRSGTYQGSSSKDFDGGTRPSNPTIGAYEYNVGTSAYPWQ